MRAHEKVQATRKEKAGVEKQPIINSRPQKKIILGV